MELAEKIKKELEVRSRKLAVIDRVEIVPPGFINFWLSKEYLISQLKRVLEQKDKFGQAEKLTDDKIMVEYAHPNTHKEMHIGHLRTLITGEALARLFEAAGAKVFRANYQGDIGPHVAKALYGVERMLSEEKLELAEIGKWTSTEKAHFLGAAYVIGNKEYEGKKQKIDQINADLYNRTGPLWELYRKTRQWSLAYYNELYKRFYTKFNRLFFESEMAECGKEVVLKNLGKVFIKDEGAIIFPGEKYGLHRRVFVTRAGFPTYEGKEMCLGFKEYEAFPFDRKIHVVGSEQSGYFTVVFKALELVDSEKFVGRQYHLSMGMVHLVNRKMSSRTGELLTVDSVINEVRKEVEKLMTEEKLVGSEKKAVAEEVTIGAIKYSVLKVGAKQDVAFDIKKSVSLEGDSGPYLQYTYARTQSVVHKSQINWSLELGHWDSSPEELLLLRTLYRFPEVIEEAAGQLAPNVLCSFLFDLAQKFNLFYQKHKIIQSERQDFRLVLTAAVGQVLKNGLYLLGIEAPERM